MATIKKTRKEVNMATIKKTISGNSKGSGIKGQAALEFLMTYGWAILATLIAISALAYFGGLNPAKYLPDKCITEAGVSCVGAKIKSTGVELSLANGLGKAVRINNISLTSASATCVAPFQGYILTAGSQFKFMVNNSGTPCSLGIVGESYKGAISVGYTDISADTNRTFFGEMTGKIE